MSHGIPLFDFDLDRTALLEPATSARYWRGADAADAGLDAPVAAVACFFPELVASSRDGGRVLMELPSGQPLWEVERAGRRLALFYPGIGAALASYSLELVIAAGCRTIIACGGAGAIRSSLPMGHHVVTVTSAVRDEGTSYHYLPPGGEVRADPDVVRLVSTVVERRNIPHLAGRTWTTDGLFRETPARVARRRDQGCLTVEMEAAALIAVAAFRGVRFGQLLYVGDDLSSGAWDSRDWKGAAGVRALLVDLAAEAALSVADELPGGPA